MSFITLKSFKFWYILVDYESNGTLKTVSEIPDSCLTNGSVIVNSFSQETRYLIKQGQ